MGRKRKFTDKGLADSTTGVPVLKRGDPVSTSSNPDVNSDENLPGIDANGSEMHPLLNEVILTNLFKYCPPELLTTCRLVCRTWRDVSLPTWRSSAIIKIIYARKNDIYVDCEEQTPLGKFLDYLEVHCGPHPFQQFTLKRWSLRDKRKPDEIISRFWKLTGIHMKSLTINKCTSPKPEDFLKLINKSCPNLEKLTLMDCALSEHRIWWKQKEEGEASYKYPVHGEHAHLKFLNIISTTPGFSLLGNGRTNRLSNYLRVRYLELLTNFPYLTRLKFDMDYNHTDEVVDLLRAVQQIRQQDEGKLANLQLGTSTPFNVSFTPNRAIALVPSYLYSNEPPQTSKEIVDILQQLRIPLEAIRLGNFARERDVKDVIELSSRTLTTLHAMMHNSQRCKFPFGLELQKLQLLCMSERFCHSWEFLKFTPNLETLEIYGEDEDNLKFAKETVLFANTPKSHMGNVRLGRLAGLNLRILVTEEDVQCLVQWMPDVRELAMFLDDQQFSVVCQNWGGLTNLEVYGTKLTDDGLTGMKVVTRASRSGNLAAVQGVDEGEGIRPNITYLTKLESFESPYTRLSDASVWNGFLRLDNLSSLTISDKLLSRKAKLELEENNIGLYDTDDSEDDYYS